MSGFFSKNLGRALRYAERGRQLFDAEGRRMRKAYGSLRSRYYRDYWEKVAADLGAELEDVGQGYYRLRWQGQHTWVCGFEVQIDDHVLLSIAGDKALSQGLLHEVGLPAPRHLEYGLGDVEQAQAFLAELGRPVVVKPVDGAGGRGVTIDIDNPKALREATMAAARAGTRFLVEEQVPGDNYRFLYLDGELIDVVRRDPPTVVGDGKHNVRELIKLENEQRLSAPPYLSMSALTDDPGVENHLRTQGLSPTHVPEAGEVIAVKGAVNQNGSRDNHKIVDGIHPSYREMGRRMQQLFDIKLLGIDVIAPDISVPLEESGGAINEINTTPAFHHHDLIAEDDKCPVGRMALEYIFARGQSAVAPEPKSIVNG